MFSVVQFPNQVCATTSGTYSNGTCITSSECSSRGGASQGSCAAGFGVCCIFTVSESGSSVSQNVSYIVNPSYPSNYAPTSTPTTLTYDIEKCSCDVCRIRLDYEVFQLTTPFTGAGAAATPVANGQCNTDYMTIKTTAHTTATDTTGNFGNYPYLCGINNGQHAYIDMSCTCTDKATLSFTLGDTTNNQWRIRVTQLGCSDPDVSNTEGCQQYFTGITGAFSSYAFDSGQMIVAQNYAYCIRPAAGYCCIEYTPVTWSVFGGSLGTAATNLDCLGPGDDNTDICSGAVNCHVNFIVVPGVQSPQTCKSNGADCFGNADGRERYCGSILTPTGGDGPASTPIITCDKPFRMFFQTGVITPGSPGATDPTASAFSTGVYTTAIAAPVNTQGFSFTYRQLPGNC